jgi:hypothetical protein
MHGAQHRLQAQLVAHRQRQFARQFSGSCANEMRPWYRITFLRQNQLGDTLQVALGLGRINLPPGEANDLN